MAATTHASELFSFGQVSQPDPVASKYYGMNPPDNHQYHGNRFSTSPAKRFSAPAAMVSEADLAEGFHFPVKKPNPPGQFSERHREQGQSNSFARGPQVAKADLPDEPAPFPADIGLTTSTTVDRSTLRNVTIPQSAQPQSMNNSPQERHSGIPQGNSAATQVTLQSSLPGPVSPTMQREASVASDKEGRAETRPHRQLGQESHVLAQPADQLSHQKLMKTSSQSSSTVHRSGAGSIPHHEKGPASVRHCGDLEGPPLCSPLKPIRTPQSRISKIKRLPRSRESSHRNTSPCERPSSQSSIMSTKTYIGKISSEPDRQRLVMSQMAQYWNKCIQISNEEKACAKNEIGRLQSELLQQNEQLRERSDLLKERNVKLQELSNRYQELEKKQFYDAESKDNELSRLNNELKQSRAQVDIMQGKYRTYRDKLNEAIKEQQELYSRTHVTHDNIINEAQKMADERTADSQAFKKALRLNTKKRNELRHKINELQREIDHSQAGKNAEIASLKEKIQIYEQNMTEDRKKFAFIQRDLESRQSGEDKTRNINAKLDHIVQLLTHRDNGQQAATERNEEMLQRMENLFKLIGHSTLADKIEGDDATLDKLADKIQQRIWPGISDATSKQGEINEMMLGWGATMQCEVSNMQQRLEQGTVQIATVMNQHETEQKELLSAVSSISNGQNTANNCLDSIVSSLGDMARSDATDRLESDMSRVLHLTRQLANSNNGLAQTSDRIENGTIQQKNDFARFKRQIAKQSKLATGELEKAVTSLHAKLGDGFHKTTQDAERTQQQYRELLNSMSNFIAEAKQAGDSGQRHEDDKSAELLEAVRVEQARAASLQEKINWLQAAREEESCQRAKWQSDMTTIAAARSQLASFEKQLDGIVNIPLRLEEICDLSSSIQATAKYMSNEHQWLEQRNQERTIRLQEQRKVIVHSPALDSGSPLPVSVEQEQRQRRERTKPRSILKSSQSSTDGSSSADSQANAKNSAHVIEEIRSGLVQQPALKRISPFSTVAEFINSSKPGNSVSETCSTESGQFDGGKGLKRRKSHVGPEPVVVGG